MVILKYPQGRWYLHRLVLLCWIALFLASAGCREQDSAASPAAAAARVPVETRRLVRTPLRPLVHASADILPRRQVVVTAETAGQVRSLHARVGDAVKAGQLLARLDTTKAGHSLDLIRAQRDRAQAALDQARRDLARAEQLARRGVTSTSQLDAARSAVSLAEAGLREASARVKLTRSQVADGRVVAPFAASVATRHVEVGDYLVPGKPVLTLVDYARVKVKAGLHLHDALRVKRGDPCTVRVELAQLELPPRQGEVIAVGAAADTASRQVPVEAEIDNADGKLRPGMIAEVTFYLGEARLTLMVPQSAVVEQFEIPYAFVVEKGHAVRRRLQLGRRQGLQVAVTSGLKPGEELVVVGQESLSPGTPVRVVKQQERPTPGAR